MRRAYVVHSPRCPEMSLAVFGRRDDATAFFGDRYPSRHDAADWIREVPDYTAGYLGYQRRKDRRE